MSLEHVLCHRSPDFNDFSLEQLCLVQILHSLVLTIFKRNRVSLISQLPSTRFQLPRTRFTALFRIF